MTFSLSQYHEMNGSEWNASNWSPLDEEVAPYEESWVAHERKQADASQPEVESPDFTCSVCERAYYIPHEGMFMGKNEPDTLCLDCMLSES